MADSFELMWAELARIGRDPASGGYRRGGWTPAEREAAAWFAAQCTARGLALETDPLGNQVAWWPSAPRRSRSSVTAGETVEPAAVVTGSHLDSVVDGGAFDGALGVVSALAAVDRLRASGVEPRVPIGVAVFVEEEGSRFGVPCLGSRVATGVLPADRALALSDRSGTTLRAVLAAAGADPDAVRPSALADETAVFVELHIEQGRGLADTGSAVGVASSIWPHGRYRFAFTGEANHAGTTEMADRHDPMLTFAMTVLAANKQARLASARATFGRVAVRPNGTNAVPSEVTAWLDARAADRATLDAVVEAVSHLAAERADRDGTRLRVTAESASAGVSFQPALRDRVVAALAAAGCPAPVLSTAAGHDAGVVAAAGVPSTMLFVRNPTGVSHSPAEHADPDDCLAGVDALAAVLRELAS